MIIPQELLEKWKALRSPGDAEKMEEKSDKEVAETFNRAFREGKCNDNVFKIMGDYFKEKEQTIKEYL